MQFIKELSQIELGIVLAIIIGILTTGIFIVYEYEENRFTYIYIYPESYNYSLTDPSIPCIYGIKSFENDEMEYYIQIQLAETVVKEERINLIPGEIFESKELIDLTNITQFPVKIELRVISSLNAYKAHLWVERRY